MSGYCECACRDCFEIAIANDGETDALCLACEDAGCEPHDGECLAPHAYCSGGEDENGRCTDCGEEF